jgi:hypothetical protein
LIGHLGDTIAGDEAGYLAATLADAEGTQLLMRAFSVGRRLGWHCRVMDFAGKVLPGLAETVVLYQLGLVRSDALPDIAARWLAAEHIDTESVRILAGHARGDRWALEQLLMDSVAEAEVMVPTSPAERQRIAVEWVTMSWRADGGIRWAVAALARLGETDPDFDVGLFVGLDDEWNAGWGRLETELKAEAVQELDRLLHGQSPSDPVKEP